MRRRNGGSIEIPPRSWRTIGRFLLLMMVAIHAAFLWSVRGRIQKGDPDFTVYYTAGKILREGHSAELYNGFTQQTVQWEFATDSDIRQGPLPYIHPPFEALIFLPLTFLPYGDAFVLWNLLNLAMLFAIALLLRRSLDTGGDSLRQIPLWEWVLALLAFFPVFANFLQGQDAILLLLVFVLGFHALDRNADFTAGCWFGLGVFKYHFVIPLVLILAVWRGRRLVLGFAAAASAAALLSLGIVGWHGALRYPGYAWRVVSLPGHGQTPIALMPNLLGFATGWPFMENLGWPWRLIVLAADAALLIVVARISHLARANGANDRTPKQTRNFTDQQFFRLSFACAVIAAVLVSYLTNAHDLCLLVLPLALLADYVAIHWSERQAVRVLLIPVVPLLLSPLWIFLWMRWGKLNLVAIPLLWWIYAMRRELQRLRNNQAGTAARITSSV
ncbi:MAG: glycosyltransferase 87 family protein [Candidatus Sulfotelmatobacter sp.]